MSMRAASVPATQPVQMNAFERYLTVWVVLCIVTGIALGQAIPGAFQFLGRLEVARVNIPVGLLIWVMIIPMLVRIDFGALHQVRDHWKGIGVTVFVNWAVKPFSMALLAWVFVRQVFAPWLPESPLSWASRPVAPAPRRQTGPAFTPGGVNVEALTRNTHDPT